MSGITKDDVRAVVKELVPVIVKDVIKETVPDIIRHETADIRSDLDLLKQVQSNQGLTMRTMQADTAQLRQLAREQGILYEDLHDNFKTLAELLGEDLTIQSQVTDHEIRLSSVEVQQKLLGQTIRGHSRKLKDN